MPKSDLTIQSRKLTFKNKFITLLIGKNKISLLMSFKTTSSEIIFDRTSQISNTTSQIKLLKRSRSKSLKIKKSQSQTSLDNSFPGFFIKKVPKFSSRNNGEQQQTTDVTPVKIIQRKSELQQTSEKKRQPTPVKSYRQMKQTSKTNKKLPNSELNMQKQMQIHELEKKLQGEIKIRTLFQNRAKQFQNQVSIQAKKVKIFEKQLQSAKQKELKLIQKVRQLETILQSKNTDLKNTKSSLQKLKDNIKQIRVQEFQTEVQSLNKQIERCKNIIESQNCQINSLRNENTEIKMEIKHTKAVLEQGKLKAQQQSKSSALKKEIQSLKQQLKISSSQKQQFLEQKISDLQRQISRLKALNQSKTIEIDFLARKKHQQLQILRKRKSQQYQALRKKFSALMDEYKQLKYESKTSDPRNKPTKTCPSKSNEKGSVQKRQNRFSSPNNQRTEDECLCFSLSPDVK